MEEKHIVKISLSTFLLFIAILIIAIMGFFLYKSYSENIVSQDKISTLESENFKLSISANTLTEELDNVKAESSKDNYLSNFSESVSKQLGKDNEIYITLSDFDSNNSHGYLSINNKHEAFLYLSTIKEYSSADNLKKIASNVVNALYCRQGQDVGNDYIVFSKLDGSVTYVRFTSNSAKTSFEDKEKVLPGITNISNILPISGNDENGIGGNGILFIKTDGTCLPFSTLDDLIQ